MKTREQKAKILEKLSALFGKSAGVVASSYMGITMKELNELRDSIRPLGGKFMVAKNTLARIASKGTQYEKLLSNPEGPIGILFLGEEGTAVVKSVFGFMKTHPKLKMFEGVADGMSLNEAGLKAYSEMPGKNEIRSMFLGVLIAPAQRMVGTLVAPARTLVGVLQAYEDKLGKEQAALIGSNVPSASAETPLETTI